MRDSMEDFLSKQGTVKSEMVFQGVGTHGGRVSTLRILPAPENTGIVFVRTDGHEVGQAARIPAHRRYVTDTTLCTALANKKGVRVRTVEHLLAALYAFAIDNAIVEIDAEELPILDGSALPYVEALLTTGRQEQKAPRLCIRVLKPITVQHERQKASISPHFSGFSLGVTCDYTVRGIPPQTYDSEMREETFVSDVAAARTFGFLEDVEALHQRGLARGASLDNTVVFSQGKCLNGGGLRFGNELARHKALDILGDLALLGRPLLARFEGENTGHALNAQLTEALLNAPESWTLHKMEPSFSQETIFFTTSPYRTGQMGNL